MQFKEIQEIITQFNDSNLSFLEIKHKDSQIKLRKANDQGENGFVPQYIQQPVMAVPPVAAPVVTTTTTTTSPVVTATEDNLTAVKSPMVGVFYVSPDPSSPPFVKVGDKVNKGDVIGLIEAMKMMSEIKATVSGVVKFIDAENEQLVAFDDVLVRIEE